jgi:hypothetical protein
MLEEQALLDSLVDKLGVDGVLELLIPKVRAELEATQDLQLRDILDYVVGSLENASFAYYSAGK